jgi:hypothetical protein
MSETPARPNESARPKSTVFFRPKRRLANEIDFWRGVALVSIFINHIPGIVLEKATHRNFGISDSAELFVFLAGFSLRYLSESRTENLTTPRLFMRLEGRTFTLYAAHILTTVLALALLAGAALYYETPLILSWHNAQTFFQDPVQSIVGIASLLYQLGYFDILPLYVVLMGFAPFIVLLHRLAPNLLLPVSIGIWAVTLTFGVNLPTWPIEGRWFFNPAAWQLNFVMGFVLARPTGVGNWARENHFWLRWVGAAIVIAGFIITMFELAPDPFSVPQPYLFFVIDKTFLSPMRFLHLLGLVALIAGVYLWFDKFRFFQPVASFFSLLGRNSLHVFCMGSILSQAGQVTRFAAPISVTTDLLVVMVGVILMACVAWMNEWRKRL